MIDNNLTKQELCDRCGVSMYALNLILSHSTDFDLINLVRLAKVLGVQIVDLIISHSDNE